MEDFNAAFGLDPISTTGMPKRMIAVRKGLEAYHKKPNKDTREVLFLAIYDWYNKGKREFTTKDDFSDGVLRKLGIQVGKLDVLRNTDHPTTMLLHAFLPAVDHQLFRADPRLTRKDRTMTRTLQEYRLEGSRKVAIVVLDLYGENFEAQGLLHKYGTSKKTNVEHIQEFLKSKWTPKNATEKEKLLTGLDVYICSKMKLNGSPSQEEGKELVKEFDSCIPKKANKKYVYSKTSNVLVGTMRDSTKTFIEDLQENGVRDVFVMGFDANLCVAASIFGSIPAHMDIPPKKIVKGQVENHGFVSYGINVITSIHFLGVGEQKGKLDSRAGWPYLGKCNVGSIGYGTYS